MRGPQRAESGTGIRRTFLAGFSSRNRLQFCEGRNLRHRLPKDLPEWNETGVGGQDRSGFRRMEREDSIPKSFANDTLRAGSFPRQLSRQSLGLCDIALKVRES